MGVVMIYYVYYVVIAIIVIKVVWRMPLPNRGWGSADQRFSEADEEITRRDSVFE
jgi:hypothetical protein